MQQSGINPLSDEATFTKEKEEKCMKNTIHHSPRKVAEEVKAVAKVQQDGLAPQESHQVEEETTIHPKDSAGTNNKPKQNDSTLSYQGGVDIYLGAVSLTPKPISFRVKQGI